MCAKHRAIVICNTPTLSTAIWKAPTKYVVKRRCPRMKYRLSGTPGLHAVFHQTACLSIITHVSFGTKNRIEMVSRAHGAPLWRYKPWGLYLHSTSRSHFLKYGYTYLSRHSDRRPFYSTFSWFRKINTKFLFVLCHNQHRRWWHQLTGEVVTAERLHV